MKSGVGRNSGGSPSVPDSLAPASCTSNLLHLQLQHRAHGVILHSRHPPAHVRGRKEVQHRSVFGTGTTSIAGWGSSLSS